MVLVGVPRSKDQTNYSDSDSDVRTGGSKTPNILARRRNIWLLKYNYGWRSRDMRTNENIMAKYFRILTIHLLLKYGRNMRDI